MTGLQPKTHGTMWYHGEVWEPGSMIEALNGGIGVIVQENGAIIEISFAENIFLDEIKQFAGESYFESRKIKDVSPLLDPDVSPIVEIKEKYGELLSSKSGAEAKELLSEEILQMHIR